MAVRYTPRWIHHEIQIPANTTVRVDPGWFANTEIWDWELHWLSVTGNVVLEEGAAAPWNDTSGGVARTLRWEIGITQYSDINLVALGGQALFGQYKDVHQLDNIQKVGLQFRFPVHFPLAPDSGLVASAQNVFDEADSNLTLTLNGYHIDGVWPNGDQKRRPAQLAGRTSGLNPQAQTDLQSSDLFNRGDVDMYLYEMMLDALTMPLDLDEDLPACNNVAWRINPSTGVQWMPNALPIPAGNIAPYNRAPRDYLDLGPRVYEFPPDIVLKPRQRLGQRITNLTGALQTIDVCLFGTLKVV
jgi:hypothetical protein